MCHITSAVISMSVLVRISLLHILVMLVVKNSFGVWVIPTLINLIWFIGFVNTGPSLFYILTVDVLVDPLLIVSFFLWFLFVTFVDCLFFLLMVIVGTSKDGYRWCLLIMISYGIGSRMCHTKSSVYWSNRSFNFNLFL